MQLEEEKLGAVKEEQTTEKLRVLVLSALIPIQGSGAGCLTMYRHFILNQDFEVAVAAARDFEIPGVPTLQISQDAVTERIRKTRFSRFVKNVDYVRNWHLIPSELVSFARSFRPDVIFSVVDDLHMGLAWQLSRKLDVPLAVDFQDLFAVSNFVNEFARPYPSIQKYLLNKYRFLNRRAEIVFHVGEGMRDWFGDERRGELLYPMSGGHKSRHATASGTDRVDSEAPLRVVYTGNSRGAYGKMVLRFANETIDDPSIDFRIYTLGTDIPDEDVQRLKDAGIYRGYLPFDELVNEMESADAFLLVMGFENNETDFVSTSFNTKWVDYVSFGKPIVVWGPDYTSASRFATEHDAALPVTSDDSAEVAAAMRQIAGDKSLEQKLADGAKKASEGPLNPKRLQELLRDQLATHCKSTTGKSR